MAWGNGAPRGFSSAGGGGAGCTSLNDYEVFFALAGGCSSDPDFKWNPSTNFMNVTGSLDWVMPNLSATAYKLRTASLDLMWIDTTFSVERFYIGDLAYNTRIDLTGYDIYLTTNNRDVYVTSKMSFLNSGDSYLRKNSGSGALIIDSNVSDELILQRTNVSVFEYLHITHSTGIMNVGNNSNDPTFRFLGDGDFHLFYDAVAGDTPLFKISGYKTADVAQRTGVFQIDPGINNMFRFSGTDVFRFYGTDVRIDATSGSSTLSWYGPIANRIDAIWDESSDLFTITGNSTRNIVLNFANFKFYDPNKAKNIFQYDGDVGADFFFGDVTIPHEFNFNCTSAGKMNVNALLFLLNIKSGVNQGAAGAAAGEVWQNSSTNILYLGV